MKDIIEKIKIIMAWILFIICGLFIIGIIFNITYLSIFNKILYICGLIIGFSYIKEH